jgi:hypothetical protein
MPFSQSFVFLVVLNFLLCHRAFEIYFFLFGNQSPDKSSVMGAYNRRASRIGKLQKSSCLAHVKRNMITQDTLRRARDVENSSNSESFDNRNPSIN